MRKIATKVLKRINKSTAKKVIDLNEYRQQKKATEDLFNEITTTETAIKAGYDPLHAVYIHTQNLLSILVEGLQAIPEPALSLFFDAIEAADEAYVPRRLSDNNGEKLSSPNYFPGNFNNSTANCPIVLIYLI